MVVGEKAIFVMLIVLLTYPNDNFGGAFQPEFGGPIANLTIPLGRDAMFTCLVEHLGGYRVGWIKADTKAIQAIHDHVITHNPRVSVTRSDHTMWNLHIKGVELEDAGLYMCQINTDPMKSQTGVLSIEVPPDFIADETSGDVMVGEGGQVKLTCRAKGVPPPHVIWKREDGKNIVMREPISANSPNHQTRTISVKEFHGEELHLTKVSRNDMGAYLCIASNRVPPSISKRITINVHFSPVIHVPNQLVGAPLGTDVLLECLVEASPMSINYWVKDNEEMIITSARHDVQVFQKSAFQVRMMLTIRNLQLQDLGKYRCAAKNSLGEVDSSIRLYGISGPTKTQTVGPPAFYDDEDEVSFGSADTDKIDSNNNHYNANKLYPVDNTVNGHVSYPSASSPTPTVKMNKKIRSGLDHMSSVGTRDFACRISLMLLAFVTIVGFRRL
ncbi:lachesin-like isoform X2 [Venturia canescens]|uniref:lachesin-like isoform X2 n=1 Tax=Venturia canescens TaxID=32260 RepID=UPI001C9D134B|nr:lachesin-like isoform X2 [Venturia canescens]